MKKRPSSGIWPESAWDVLLRQAIRILDSAPPTHWTFGGGSSLALRFQHRISYDADLFLHDVQILGHISPRLNDISASLSASYDEAANGIKITTGRGDIDFVVAADVTAEKSNEFAVPGLDRTMLVQTPAEVLAKKIQYRGFKFTHRDIFDLAMLLERDPGSVDTALRACSRAEVAKAAEVMRSRLGLLRQELPDYVNPTPDFEGLIERADGVINSFLKHYDHMLRLRRPGS